VNTSNNNVLRMRVAIEYSPSTEEHWARVRALCLEIVGGQLVSQTCQEVYMCAAWVDNRDVIGTRCWDTFNTSDVTRTGTRRTPVRGHAYIVRMSAFAIFADGYIGQVHLICSNEMIYQGGGTYSDNGQWC